MAPQPHSPRTQSPLTRGKHPAWILRVIASRLIPAHAGKTMSETMITVPSWAHPRSRGENAAGLPEPGAGHRLIPAHAGKTCRDPSRRPIHRAHPRSRGENLISSRRPAQLSGSSPLTRGKRDRPRRAQALRRLIPAHAGKTRQSSRNARQRAAHPRSRGENLGCLRVRQGHLGSSPLTRGKPDQRTYAPMRPRLIPAHAGKTRRPGPQPRRPRAHPRSRGEN